tara:strand:+ start:479 stop:1057 length:579 start_codon:yes stop_codon:yes gene_type:complete
MTLLITVTLKSGTLLLLPIELILPVLGILLIRTESPIRGLIYRSFLGSIAALIYASVGAPDVALTEVLVGTLLSAILYIITIRACYTVLIVIPKDFNLSESMSCEIKELFNELHLQVKYLKKDMESEVSDYKSLLVDTTLAGSPHAVLDGQGLFMESDLLLRDLQTTSYFKSNKVSMKLLSVTAETKSGGQP